MLKNELRTADTWTVIYIFPVQEYPAVKNEWYGVAPACAPRVQVATLPAAPVPDWIAQSLQEIQNDRVSIRQYWIEEDRPETCFSWWNSKILMNFQEKLNLPPRPFSDVVDVALPVDHCGCTPFAHLKAIYTTMIESELKLVSDQVNE